YRPKPWTVDDSLVCGLNMVQALNHGEYLRKILREDVTRKLGPELAADLYVNSSWRDRPPTQAEQAFEFQEMPENEEEQSSRPKHDRLPHSSRAKNARDEWGTHGDLSAADEYGAEMDYPGSNNWVVSGQHTAS